MSMDYKSSRSFAMTLSHRAVEDIRRDGFRQLRNYVDMCAMLANQPKQKGFFAYAQKTLQKTDSLYYSLIHSLVDTVQENRICTVGVNLGFGGLIHGGSRMKAEAEKTGQPCSWLNVGLCGDPALPAAVQAAEEKGSFVWVLSCGPAGPAPAAALAASYPHSAFLLLAPPEQFDSRTLTALEPCNNVVLLLLLQRPELDHDACETARQLRAKKMFYGFCALVDDTTANEAIDPEWIDAASQYGLFCLYARRAGMSAPTSELLRQSVAESRVELGAPMLLLDWEGDVDRINKALSPHAVLGVCLPENSDFPLQTTLTANG